MVERKGIGYMVEAMVAIIILFLFAVGNSASPPSQDWNEFRDEMTANDLTYTLKNTGHLNSFVQRRETGSLETTVSTLTDESLEVSGSIEGLPLNNIHIGFHIPESRSHPLDTEEVTDDPNCDLGELESRSNDDIRRTTDDHSWHDTVLYFVDSDLGDGYDSMWVDNGTECQFADEDGPFYTDQFFQWGEDSGDYEYYKLEDIDEDGGSFTVHEASNAVRLREVMEKPLNGIKTSQDISTFESSDTNTEIYDIIVIRGEDSLDEADSEDEIEEFLHNKPILVMADLEESDLENGFLDDKGLRWVDLDITGTATEPNFGTSSNAEEIETYFRGLEGDIDGLTLEAGGKVSSSNSRVFMEEDPLLFATQGTYDTDPWNATNYSMEMEDPADLEGLPESACYEEGEESESLTVGSFNFSTSEDPYEVASVEMGKEESDCSGIRSLNIKKDENFSDRGPFLSDEILILDGKTYRVDITDEEVAEFEFVGNNQVEMVNYRESFEDFRGDRLARISYQDQYSEDDRKLIASTIYWLVRDDIEFGQEEPGISTSIVGSMNENTYMPYKTFLRWN